MTTIGNFLNPLVSQKIRGINLIHNEEGGALSAMMKNLKYIKNLEYIFVCSKGEGEGLEEEGSFRVSIGKFDKIV